MASSQILTMKILINTKSHKVLFAEAGNEVVDFLFGILCLPLGAIVKRVPADSVAVGSLGILYQSLVAMNDAYLYSKETKASLLDPVVVSSASLSNLLKLPAPPPPKRASNYRCSTLKCHSSCIDYHRDVSGTLCPACTNQMTTLTYYAQPFTKVTANAGGRGPGYMRGPVTYTVMDDLTVTPSSPISSFTMFNKLHIKDATLLQEKTVQLDSEKGLELLRCSLQSKTVLTDVFLAIKKEQTSVVHKLMEARG